MTDNTPSIIPSLRQWKGLGRELTLPETCRLVIAPAGLVELAETAQTLQELLSVEIGKPMTVITGLTPAKGDIFLMVDKHNQEIGDQGYILEIDGYVKVHSATATGIF